MKINRTAPDGDRAAPPADFRERYDVAVLGGTMASGLLAAVLARQGVRVLVVPGAEDRSEPSGETTVPYTAEVFLLLAKRFDIPEIAAFGLFPDLPADVRRDSGVKKSLGFLHHRVGQRQNPEESIQFNVPGEHAEWHLERRTVDAYTLRIAHRYGAAILPHGVHATDAWTEEDGARIETTDGHVWKARYLVDVSGPGSFLVARNGGDDPEPRLSLRSRVIATHMTGVTAFEDVRPVTEYPKATAWSEGTVHHLFDGGWIQLVRFDNHPGGANPATGVTLSLDPDRWGHLPDDPEKAFRTVVEQFPDLDKQFASATAVRPWTNAPLWQRTAARTYGDRWFALERTASRNDLFLSRDVTMATEVVHALAGVLVPAVRRDDFSVAPFAKVAAFQDELAAFNDRWLACARTAARDFQLYNAFSRVWLLWQILADLSLKRARLDCESSAGRDWSAVERFELGGIWFHVPEGLRGVIDRSLRTIERVGSGDLRPSPAAESIFAELRREKFIPPLYAFGDPDARVYHFTIPKRLKMLWWVKTAAPADFRRLLTRDNVTSVTSASSR
ncbi:NAD(P)/FAD-dependent oxidoreductase [Streptomyces sp. NPDC054829]